ncbi:hypothetical protein AiwAL_19375 [Acidiphilium sp. AL]|uniref:DUF6927 domain-containing protein n=1 Tax=Acidiphilium sp. AL TaxID=2871704 RepID=UPI0021CAFFD9|nr:hypothetical protein [Acidiphilium sp. AL]MCU4162210.1 hypothetical protein [Acidiphilium sp. AL]
MGWLYMKSLEGHSGPRQYLDAQFTWTRPDTVSTVLRSALVGRRVYYAAIEHIRTATAKREVWACVCLVRHNVRDRESYIFGYRDMAESMGPHERHCPEPILDLLTPTDSEYARQWRADCRANAAARRARQAKPAPRAGQTIVFDEPIAFADGNSVVRLAVTANPRRPRTVLFRAPGSSCLYRIPDIKNRAYRLVDPLPE